MAHQQQFNGTGVYAGGVVAHQVGLVEVPHAFQKVFNQFVKPQVLGNQGHQVCVKRIGAVHAVLYLLSVGFAVQQTSFFQFLQFHAHGIGGVAKFFGQAAQMPHGVRSAEKLEQELQAGLAGDEGSEDGTGFLRLRRRTASPGRPQLSTAVCFSE